MHIPSPFCKNKLMSAGEINPHSLTFMWETRPVRFPKKQKRSVWVAGICEGIAVRYNIDPVLVRIAFIIATISGYGLSLYLLLWLCLPRYSVDRAPFEVLSNNHYGKYNHDQSTGWVLVIVLALLIGPGLNSFSPIFVITTALAISAYWALHKRTPYPPKGLIADKPTIIFRAPVDLSSYHPAAGFSPKWDPLLIDAHNPPLDYASVYGTQPLEQSRKWPNIIIRTILLICAVTAAFIGFGAVSSISNEDVGDVHVTISLESEISDYEAKIGNLTVDFSQLKTVTEDHTNSYFSDIGDIDVTLSPNVRYKVLCNTNTGNAECPANIVNPDAPGGLVTLDLYTDIGNIYVSTAG